MGRREGRGSTRRKPRVVCNVQASSGFYDTGLSVWAPCWSRFLWLRETSDVCLVFGSPLEMGEQMNQGADRMAGGTLGKVRLLLVRPAGAGDVQMDPGRIAGKLAHKHGSGDGAAVTSAGIREIRDGALVEIAIVVIDGQFPHPVSDGFGARQHALHPVLVPPEDAGGDVAESDHDRAGEGGGVDQHRGALLLGVSK